MALGWIGATTALRSVVKNASGLVSSSANQTGLREPAAWVSL